jgi:hypothetical protein
LKITAPVYWISRERTGVRMVVVVSMKKQMKGMHHDEQDKPLLNFSAMILQLILYNILRMNIHVM